MNKTNKKSGRSRFSRKKIADFYHESTDKVGKHFSDNFISRIQNAHEVRLWIIEWVLLIVVVFLFAIVQSMWYGDSYHVDAYVKGGNYTEAVLGEVSSMNPLYATTNAEKTLGRLLFANLVSPDGSSHSKGELAKSAKMDNTGRVWTVTLRDNIFWSDGEPILADDVIFTVDLIRDRSAKTTISADFSHVSTKKINEKTIEFTLPSTYVDFMDSLEFPVVPRHILGDISPALVYESDFSTHPVCSGPFVLNAMQAANVTNLNTQTIYLNRNTKYFLSDTKLDTFTLKTYKKREDIIEALNASEATATAELANDSAEKLRKGISSRESLLNGGVFAFINTKSDNLSNKYIRQAISRGVNMNKVRENIDESQILDYPILERQESLTYPELLKYDLNAAKELIAKAQFKYNKQGKIVDKDGLPVVLNIAVQKRDTITEVAERFAEELRLLGFDVSVNVYDESQTTADFFTAVVRPRDYDILFYEVNLGVSADPFVYYSSTQATAGGWNFSNYTNSLVDDALLSAHTTTNMNIRKAKYEYFLKTWAADVPAIAMYQSSLKYYYESNVQIYSENLQMTDVLDRFNDVRYWASEKRSVNVTP
ncbi:MAG: ABC transporter substrate-binding protein [Candidatus Saccharibacteria bacterium]|nr:ABC transporter substrate-binding protein [Candidatus Saccharibacteria bacterium]